MQPLNATYKDTPVRVHHIENGTAYVVRPDGSARCVDWHTLRFPKDPTFVAQAPAVPAPLPVVRWAEWVELGALRIERPGVSEDGTEHWQTVYPAAGLEGWAWDWRCGDSTIHSREGFSELQWARRDCEVYTAIHAGPTPIDSRTG
jgi:hypothetical protein